MASQSGLDPELISAWGKAAGTFVTGALIVLAGYKWPKLFHKDETPLADPSQLPSALAITPNELRLIREDIDRIEDIVDRTYHRVDDLCEELERVTRAMRQSRDEARDFYDTSNKREK